MNPSSSLDTDFYVPSKNFVWIHCSVVTYHLYRVFSDKFTGHRAVQDVLCQEVSFAFLCRKPIVTETSYGTRMDSVTSICKTQLMSLRVRGRKVLYVREYYGTSRWKFKRKRNSKEWVSYTTEERYKVSILKYLYNGYHLQLTTISSKKKSPKDINDTLHYSSFLLPETCPLVPKSSDEDYLFSQLKIWRVIRKFILNPLWIYFNMFW